MKKITLLIVSFILIYVTGFGQSQRLVMFEEFTQASCPPCAAANPGLNALLDANPSKVVSVKYQTSWPGVDPMNAQNPTQVATRVSYYGVNSVPDGQLDGTTGFSGQPAGLMQSDIDGRYAMPSPFTILVSHHLSATSDTIYAHATINCTQGVTGTLVAHMAVVERDVYFATAPGTNGETHFEGVMKHMLPSVQGTVLATSWLAGDSVNLDYSWKLANVYDTNQLAVVVWVQDNASAQKEVLQAGYSRPQPAYDAGVIAINNVNGAQCSSTVNPVFDVHNFAINPLTSCNINYQVDGGAVQTVAWTGNIPSDSDGAVAIPTITLAPGSHTIAASTASPNGNTDLNLHNDRKSKLVAIFSAPVTAPVTQNFSAGTFPPIGWTRENVNADAIQWLRSNTTLGGLTGSAKMDFYDALPGTIDNLYPPIFDYSTAVAGATLEFDIAHAQYGPDYLDQLKVNASTDCGVTWTTVWDKMDPALSTLTGGAYDSAGAYTPNSAQWRHEVIDMSSYAGQSSVLVQFQAISGYGNNVYIDNVNISLSAPLAIHDLSSNENVSVYPNPAAGNFFVKMNFKKPENVTITVTNPIGEIVRTIEQKNISSGVVPVNLLNEAKGNYIVNIKSDSGNVTKKIVIIQ